MDIHKGLIITPTDDEITRRTRGFNIRGFAENRPVLPKTATEINLYTYEEPNKQPPAGTKGPLHVVFLTSIRDIGRYDLNGIDLMGAIEAINTLVNEDVKLCIDGDRVNLGDFIRIRGIITDDVDNNPSGNDYLGCYPATPTRGKPWIHPLDARNDKGNYLTDITTHIPSDFRTIRRGNRALKEEKRLEFEKKIFEVSQQRGADILISDHFMVKLVHLIKGTRYGTGRVLNIHPGISDPRNPNRLPGSTPTLDAISRAQWGAIFDKKRKLYVPPPDPRASRFSTGASLHVMDEGLDTGPVIADSESTYVGQSDRPQELRRKNYPIKRAVLVAGIIHYVKEMISKIDGIDFGSGERTTIKSIIKQE